MNCPDCGHETDRHTVLYAKKPRTMDLIICRNCDVIYQFKGTAVPLVPVDIEKLPDNVKQEIAKFKEVRRTVLGT